MIQTLHFRFFLRLSVGLDLCWTSIVPWPTVGILQLVSHNVTGLCNPSDRPMDFQDEAADDYLIGADPIGQWTITHCVQTSLTWMITLVAQTPLLENRHWDTWPIMSSRCTPSQANKVKANVDAVAKEDKLMRNQTCPKYLRRRPCLPHGCKIFLIFAGCVHTS